MKKEVIDEQMDQKRESGVIWKPAVDQTIYLHAERVYG